MKKILLVYLPFCTPASPPYSITHLYSFLKNNCSEHIEVLDLNLEFHKLKFPEYQTYYKNIKNWSNYDKTTHEYIKLTSTVYSDNNKKVVKGEKPEFFNELIKKITDKEPDIVAFSIVYSSQAFYGYSIIKELTSSNKQIINIIGGPAINEKLMKIADKVLNNEIDLLDYILGKKITEEQNPEHDKLNFNFSIDFSIYNLTEYFTIKPVIPIKTSSTCYYKKCAFCSHFNKTPYHEFSLDLIKKTIINSTQRYFFLIDDMIPTKRLLEIAEVFKPLNIYWTCQLKPTKDLNYEILKKLKESGLRLVMWGVESGNDRILKLMRKGTNKKEIKQVLQDSHDVGIKNNVYILLGFPTETKDEFLETIEFLKKNERNIDLVSASVFGLQKNTEIYNHPDMFGITNIIEEERTILDPKISYELREGLTQDEACKLRNRYKKTIEHINKYPKTMSFFREHMFCLIE
ncbi:radical SAM protein [Candidatus Woesearchaeota archaeon]|nr:radical SAM protein [Candidatus Woesearchaeota archaeon]